MPEQNYTQFHLGIFGTLAIAGFAWLGIRGMTWFLFAQSGTPTIMALIQRTGLQGQEGMVSVSLSESGGHFEYVKDGIKQIKKDIDCTI